MNTRHGLLVVLAVPALILGCSSDSDLVFAPEPALSAETVSSALGTTTDSEWVGPQGGSLSVTGVFLTIPEGALETETLIQMTKNVDGSVELEPHGQVFSAPVQLRFAILSGAGGAQSCVQWFDPATMCWQTIPSSDWGFARVAPLEHFSLYRLISMSK